MNGTIGEIRLFGGNFAPRNWAFCDGQILPVSQNTALFSIIGTIYGGDGRTTFALPDLRGRSAIGPGTGPGLPTYQAGAPGGEEQTVMTSQNLPSHNHNNSIKANSGENEECTPANTFPGYGSMYAYEKGTNEFLSGVVSSPVGGGQGINNMQPSTAISFIICLQGIYPSRS